MCVSANDTERSTAFFPNISIVLVSVVMIKYGFRKQLRGERLSSLAQVTVHHLKGKGSQGREDHGVDNSLSYKLQDPKPEAVTHSGLDLPR